MRHHGFIAGTKVESDSDFIVFGPCLGLVGECGKLADAKHVLEVKMAELKQCNAPPEVGIFHWSDGKWRFGLSPYEIQEQEIQRNPTRAFHLQ